MAELDILQSDDEIFVPFNELEVGTMYPINALFKESRKFDNKVVDSIKADVSTCSLLKKLTYLPSSCSRASIALFNQINDAGKTAQKFQVCYYGSIGKKYIGRIHKPGDGPSQALLDEVAKCSSASSLKRTSDADTSSSPCKIVKIE